MSKQAKNAEKQVKDYQNKVRNQATMVLSQLVSQFYEAFNANDPGSSEVSVVRKQVIAKWKVYCIRMKLLENSFSLCEGNIKSIEDKYNEQMKQEVKEIAPVVKTPWYKRILK